MAGWMFWNMGYLWVVGALLSLVAVVLANLGYALEKVAQHAAEEVACHVDKYV